MGRISQSKLPVPGLESPLQVFTLENCGGLRVELCNLGASLQSVHVADRQGRYENVVLSYSNPRDHLNDAWYLGVTVGRVANRIGGAAIQRRDKRFALTANEGINQLHGGPAGLSQKRWQAELLGDKAVRFSCRSADGESGYPGNLEVELTYELDDEDTLKLVYEARCDQDTPVSLTNHAYWNLAGRGDVLGHRLQLAADQYLALDSAQIPTGEMCQVAGTAMDFRQVKPIGRDIDQVPGGYDHFWVVNRQNTGILKPIASLADPCSGRQMNILSTEPGVQFYSGNFLDGSRNDERGRALSRHSGLCLECHGFPDAPNHPHFPTIWVPAGQIYKQITTYQFGVIGSLTTIPNV